jgi:hypothetical protein
MIDWGKSFKVSSARLACLSKHFVAKWLETVFLLQSCIPLLLLPKCQWHKLYLPLTHGATLVLRQSLAVGPGILTEGELLLNSHLMIIKQSSNGHYKKSYDNLELTF